MRVSHLSTHSSVNGHLGCSRVLATVNYAAVNTGVQVSFWIMVFSGQHLGLELGFMILISSRMWTPEGRNYPAVFTPLSPEPRTGPDTWQILVGWAWEWNETALHANRGLLHSPQEYQGPLSYFPHPNPPPRSLHFKSTTKINWKPNSFFGTLLEHNTHIQASSRQS